MKEIAALDGKTITLERNEFLKQNGSVDTNVYYIASGSVRVFTLDNDQEQTIRLGYTGNLVVLLDSFLRESPSALRIQAIKKTVVKIIPKSEIRIFLESDANNRLWIALLESLVLQQLEREIDILTSASRERYERVLRRSPQLFQEIPHKHIANYLRMTPETLSRLKKS